MHPDFPTLFPAPSPDLFTRDDDAQHVIIASPITEDAHRPLFGPSSLPFFRWPSQVGGLPQVFDTY
jgi:hypothetical protein